MEKTKQNGLREQKNGIKFYDTLNKPFKINGLLKPYGQYDFFMRMPQEIADKVNSGVKILGYDTSGGRVRFKTNSPYVAIDAKMHDIQIGNNFPLSATAGFDLYEKNDGAETYIGSFLPPLTVKDDGGYESIIEFDCIRERELIINFPLFSGVNKLYVGIDENSSLTEAGEYAHPVPIVYYGSSITHGACASRPGNTYERMISRNFDCDFINLGFNGSARAEKIMAEYIASLEMSVFVYDYDHNAPDVEYLEKTHKPMYDIIRKAHPDIPIIMMSRPQIYEKYDRNRRFEVINQTYQQAKSNGENVYIIDGREVMKKCAWDSGTVDTVHPNDLGFYCIAETVGDILKNLI